MSMLAACFSTPLSAASDLDSLILLTRADSLREDAPEQKRAPDGCSATAGHEGLNRAG